MLSVSDISKGPIYRIPENSSRDEDEDNRLRILSVTLPIFASLGTLSAVGLFAWGGYHNDSQTMISAGGVGAVTLIGTLTQYIFKRYLSVRPQQRLQEVAIDRSGSIEEIETQSINDKIDTLMNKQKYKRLNAFINSNNDRVIILKDLNQIVLELFKDKELQLVNNKISRKNFAKDLFKLFYYFDGQRIDVEQVIIKFKKILLEKTNDLKNYVSQIQSRVNKDRAVISEIFKINATKKYEIHLTEGETHNHGKKVCFLSFGKMKIVYKPHDIRIDNLICGQENSLFEKINSMSSLNGLPTYKILCLKDENEHYGYAEFLLQTPEDRVLSLEEAKLYYQMLGYILAIAKVLGIRDLHRENILIYKKSPYPIDFEVSGNIESLVTLYEKRPTEMQITYNKKTQGWECSDEINEDDEQNFLAILKQGEGSMKKVLANCREMLYQFVESLPTDLELRYVPIETNQFTAVNKGQIIPETDGHEYSSEIIGFFKDSNSLKTLKKLELMDEIEEIDDTESSHRENDQEGLQNVDLPKKLEETNVTQFIDMISERLRTSYKRELEHADVPIITCDLNGKFMYKKLLLVDLSRKRIKSQSSLKATSSNSVEPFESPQRFREELVCQLLYKSIEEISR